MIQVSVHSLKEGDKLAKSVVTHSGAVMLSSGTLLTTYYIKRLIERGITAVYIDCGPAPRPEPKETKKEICGKTSNQRKECIINFLLHKLDYPSLPIFSCNERKKSVFKRMYRKTVFDISCEPMIVELLIQLYENEPPLLEHCANVSLLSGMIGTEYGFDNARMLELLIGSLLYDIGMLELPASILHNDQTLSLEQRDLLTHHTVNGYHMLRSINGMPERSALCALLHHEKYDGSGYPFRLTGSDIPDYAQIVGMTDLYDALLSPKPYRSPYKPADAIELLYAAGNHYFRADLINIFLKLLTVNPVTSVLKLNNGQTGIVKSYTPSFVHRPELDLTQARNITVLQAGVRSEM